MKIKAFLKRLCLFLLLLIIYFVFFANERIDLSSCFHEDTDTPTQLCIDGYFHGTGDNAGAGNVIFEMLTFLAIARKTNRYPIITHPRILKRLEEVKELFPNLYDYIVEKKPQGKCSCFKQTVKLHTKCCTVDAMRISEIQNSRESTIRIHQFYTQGTRYLSLLSSVFIRRMLNSSSFAIRAAKNDIFAVRPKKNQRNVCIHIRRSDFAESPLVFPTDASFSQAAVAYILEKEGRNLDVYVFSDDSEFSRDVFLGWMNVFVAKASERRPVTAEWEFSKLYCDVVLLTEAASTYGWWLAYLSRGQKVYYNKNFSRPGGLEVQMTPSHFWPKDWIPLKMTVMDEIVEEPW